MSTIDEINQLAFEHGQPAENGDGYLFSQEQFDAFAESVIATFKPIIENLEDRHDLGVQERDRLRALIANHSEEPHKEAEHAHEWDINDQGTATVCNICGMRSSEEPLRVVEPVAWQAFSPSIRHWLYCYDHEEMESMRARGFVIRDLYVSPPAPVAVVPSIQGGAYTAAPFVIKNCEISTTACCGSCPGGCVKDAARQALKAENQRIVPVPIEPTIYDGFDNGSD